MNWELLRTIDGWFEKHREELLCDLKRIVKIPSVSRPLMNREAVTEEERKKYGPFGPDCKRVLDEMLQIGREHGFFTENYEYYVGGIGEREKNWDKLLGFWNHLDVVPTGEGWSHDPFDPVEKDGFLIGRGVQDNKGPAIGMLYLMQCIRELEIPMRHELCLFVGTDEERRMDDLAYYTAHYPTPALSMIADSGFPVCYGEKGIIEGKIISAKELSPEILYVKGGIAGNMIPAQAIAVFAPREGMKEFLENEKQRLAADRIMIQEEAEGICVTALGTSRHSAFPQGSVNAIHELADFLRRLSFLSSEDHALFSFIGDMTGEYYGERAGIAYCDEVSGRTTCTGTMLTMRGRKVSLNLNIRYAITADSELILQQLENCAREAGQNWELERDSKPGYFPKEHPAVDFLTQLYNEWQGLSTKAFVMGGGTYARKLPNAFAYGIGGMPQTEQDRLAKQKLFAPGTGGAHEPDEGLNIRQYFEAIKFYTLAVIELDRIW